MLLAYGLCTNPVRYGDPEPGHMQDSPIAAEEAQNVTEGERPLGRKDAEHERNKATKTSQPLQHSTVAIFQLIAN